MWKKTQYIIKPKHLILIVIVVMLALAVSACSSIVTNNRVQDQEESGTVLSLDETYDQARNGAWLVLAYDWKSNSFKGNVENITDGILKQVRVEIHLSNGVELGPTTPTDLNPGESIEVILTATTSSFDGWTAHPEIGESSGGEHGEGEGKGKR